LISGFSFADAESLRVGEGSAFFFLIKATGHTYVIASFIRHLIGFSELTGFICHTSPAILPAF